MKYSKPGDLIKASRDPKMKRSVMSELRKKGAMPMMKRKVAKKGLISGAVSAYQGATKGLQNVGANMAKNVSAGQKALSSGAMPKYGAINPMRGSGAAFESGFKKKAKKRKASDALIGTKLENKERNAKHYKKAKKGSMSLVKGPAKHSRMRRKGAVSGSSFGDEKLQGTKLEHARERMNDVKKSAKRQKGSESLIKQTRNTHFRRKGSDSLVTNPHNTKMRRKAHSSAAIKGLEEFAHEEAKEKKAKKKSK